MCVKSISECVYGKHIVNTETPRDVFFSVTILHFKSVSYETSGFYSVVMLTHCDLGKLYGGVRWDIVLNPIVSPVSFEVCFMAPMFDQLSLLIGQ